MIKPTVFLPHLLAVCALAALSGCAVTQTPATLHAPLQAEASAPRVLARPLDIVFDTGYSRAVAAGSRWQRVGSIEHGAVYKPYLDVFTLEGAHIHEAYLVVERDTLVGFYLPAERGFSPLKHQLAIHFE